jgi:hypothetical protein
VLARGLFVWQSSAATDAGEMARLLCLARARAVDTVFLEAEGLVASQSPALPTFTRVAGDAGVLTELLFGAADWALRPQHAYVVALAQAAVSLSGADGGPLISGLHFDIEPYVLPEWAADPPGTANQLLELLERLNAVTADAGVRLTVDMPFWYDTVSVSRDGGPARPLHELVIDRVPRVLVMAYRDGAGTCTLPSLDGLITHSSQELPYAASVGRQAWIAVDTSPATPSKVTFREEGTVPMEAALAETACAYPGPSLAGLAVHDWASYRVLGPDGPADAGLLSPDGGCAF